MRKHNQIFLYEVCLIYVILSIIVDPSSRFHLTYYFEFQNDEVQLILKITTRYFRMNLFLRASKGLGMEFIIVFRQKI